MKKFYILYQTTNLITQEIYIGVHETINLNDGYLGSGTKILESIKVYGRNNFEKIILEFFDTREEMYEREAEIVNKEFLLKENSLNMALGGHGSSIIENRKPFTKNHSLETKKKLSNLAKGRVISEETRKKISKNNFSKKDPEKQREHAKFAALKSIQSKKEKTGKIEVSEQTKEKIRKANLGKKHTECTKRKMSNSRMNRPKTRWIYSELEKKTRMIPLNHPLPQGWLEGRKMKFDH